MDSNLLNNNIVFQLLVDAWGARYLDFFVLDFIYIIKFRPIRSKGLTWREKHPPYIT